MNKIMKCIFLSAILAQSLVFAGQGQPGFSIDTLPDAARAGDLEKVKHFLASGEDVNAGENGITPLMLAAGKGHLAVVKELLSQRANVNAQDRFGETALMKAAENNWMEVVRELLSGGANINIVSKTGTAIQKAFLYKNIELIKIIGQWSIENQVKSTREKDQEILDYAIFNYFKKFFNYGQRKEAIEKATGISTQGPGKHIIEYLGEE